jgi:hypothetical protein
MRIFIVSAADPEQAVEFHSGGGGGVRVEGIAGIDYYAEFSAAGSGGERGEEQAGAAGGGGAADFGEASAGQAAGQGVNGGDAAGSHFRGGTVFELRGWGYAGRGNF